MQATVGKVCILSSSFQWKINNYRSFSNLGTGEYISSPEFPLNEHFWKLELYPNGGKASVQDEISIALKISKKVQSKNTEFQMKLSLSLIDDSQHKIIKTHICNPTFGYIIVGWGINNFVKKSLMVVDSSSHEMPNEISIICKLIVPEEKPYKTSSFIDPDRMDHFEELQHQLNKEKFSDVIFEVQDKMIYAHKIILTAVSGVFTAMFEHNMIENEENIVLIKDIKYEVFYELLIFVYSGVFRIIKEDILSELFAAADRYQILKLKDKCEQELVKKLSVDNVIALIQLADMHCAESFKKTAIDFFVLHGNEIIDQPSFQAIGRLNHTLFQDIFRNFFSRIPKV